MRRTQEEICAEIRRRRDLYREKKRRQKRILLTALPVLCLAVVMAGGLWKSGIMDMTMNNQPFAPIKDGSPSSSAGIAPNGPGCSQPTEDADGTTKNICDGKPSPAPSTPQEPSDDPWEPENIRLYLADRLPSLDDISQMRLTDHRTGRSATLDGTLCREILEDVLYPVLLWSIDGDEAGDKEQSFAELVLILSDGETSQRVMFYEDGILALNGEVFETDGEGIALIEYLIDCFWDGQKG